MFRVWVEKPPELKPIRLKLSSTSRACHQYALYASAVLTPEPQTRISTAAKPWNQRVGSGWHKDFIATLRWFSGFITLTLRCGSRYWLNLPKPAYLCHFPGEAEPLLRGHSVQAVAISSRAESSTIGAFIIRLRFL